MCFIATSGERMRILVVEDNKKLGQGLKHLLNDSSFVADLVEDGDGALSAAAAFNYDLIILGKISSLIAWCVCFAQVIFIFTWCAIYMRIFYLLDFC